MMLQGIPVDFACAFANIDVSLCASVESEIVGKAQSIGFK
jgi:hypothetical protein